MRTHVVRAKRLNTDIQKSCIYKYYTCPAVTSNMHCISGSPFGAGHVDEGGPLQRRRPEQAEARQQLVVVVVVRVSSNMV